MFYIILRIEEKSANLKNIEDQTVEFTNEITGICGKNFQLLKKSNSNNLSKPITREKTVESCNNRFFLLLDSTVFSLATG